MPSQATVKKTKKAATKARAPAKKAPASSKKASSKASTASTKTSKTSDTPARDHYHHGDLRRALLLAAKDELADVGVDELSLRGVARRAGVSHAAPYHHFADKQTLLAWMARDAFIAFAAALRAGADSVDAVVAAGEPGGVEAARLRAIGAAYVRFALAEPAFFSLISGGCSPDLREIWSEAADDSFAVLVTAVTAVRARAGLDGDATDDAMLHWSVVHGLAKLAIDQGLRAQVDVDALWMRMSARLERMYLTAPCLPEAAPKD
jgi:AcrR family transcriptional regulator